MVTSSCTSGKKSTRVEHWELARAAPRNKSSNLEGLGHDGGLHTSQTLSAAQESIVVNSGSGLGNTTLPEEDNAAESSSPEDSSSPCDAAIDIGSSGGAPNETTGPHGKGQHAQLEAPQLAVG
ncbi:hypothetical protein PO909_015151 [Leuciscus waleckii]